MGKIFKITVNARTYDIEVGDLSEDPVQVLVDGELLLVQVEQAVSPSPVAAPSKPSIAVEPTPVRPRKAPEPVKATKAPQVADDRMVTAPMPGVVLAMKVKAGDNVKRGEEVCTLESMKMELNIMAARDGVVSKICVTVGQSVVHGTVLMELE